MEIRFADNAGLIVLGGLVLCSAIFPEFSQFIAKLFGKRITVKWKTTTRVGIGIFGGALTLVGVVLSFRSTPVGTPMPVSTRTVRACTSTRSPPPSRTPSTRITLTSIPSEDLVTLIFRNPNQHNILVIIKGPVIGEMEVEVSAEANVSIHLPPGSYEYQVHRKYVPTGGVPTRTPSPEPGFCGHYQGQFVLEVGEQMSIDIHRLKGPHFIGCSPTTPVPIQTLTPRSDKN